MAEARSSGAVRTAIAILTLCGTAAAVAILECSSTSRPNWLAVVIVAALLVVPAGGLALRRWWGRWLGLAAGVTGTLYAVLLSIRHSDGAMMAFAIPGPLLLASLTGRAMFDRFDRPAGISDDYRTRVVRWAVITNVASLVTLTLLSYATYQMRGFYERVSNDLVIFATAPVVIVGVLLLARGKTAGLIAAVAGIVTQVLMLLTWHQGRATLFVLLGPGLLLAGASVIVYAAPIWRFLRGR